MKAPDRWNKYHARKTTVDGITFDSAAEARRWSELRLLERNQDIRDLERQRDFPLTIYTFAGARLVIGVYRADFAYYDVDQDTGYVRRLVVEDVKGVRTPLYVWKRKHFEAEYGITITEIRYGARRRSGGPRVVAPARV